MIETISLKRQGAAFCVELQGKLEREKAAAISAALEKDGLSAKLDPLDTAKHLHLSAAGLIRPVTARIIINALAR